VEFINTPLQDLYIVKPKVFLDDRGYFFESYSQIKMQVPFHEIVFVQDNQSLSLKKGTLRGIHFQNNPKAQTKLVRCIQGAILDIAVDLRKGSPTYQKWFGIELTSENYLQLLVPKGFGHGFITLKDNTIVAYKVDEYFSKEHDRSIRFNDEQLRIDWKNLTPILSEKDFNAPSLKDSDVNFNL
jgi:dTDP-4-dehydrorhamnose 3,5-epimerase